ncbi:MAG: metallophosphoesterase family protein [Burkholderiales bacterium]|nr:metallophosphoesterase family protein [Burkholderiales bacterium]
MIIALLSDIHGNFGALNACLKHASESGAGRYAFLGDLVGYGAEPREVIETVAGYAAGGAVAVKGNHDEAVAKTPSYMNEAVRAVADWTRETLSGDAKSFLASLPLCVREEDMCFVHASAAAPERWEYIDSPSAAQRSIDAAGAAYTFSGHVHEQELYFEGARDRITVFQPTRGSAVPVRRHRRWLALVGSVGQPRDRNPAAAYALFDSERSEITFHRVPYDHLAAARKIRQAGLPASIAYRVENGI